VTEIGGRVAVVTGGAAGIGRALAGLLRDEGASVVIADHRAGPLRAAAAELGVEAIETDVTSEASVAALAAEVVARHHRVDLVVNNAGIGMIRPIAAMTTEDWRRILDVDLWGVIHGVAAFLPLLEANPDGGHLVNVGSMSSFVCDIGLGAYTVAKHGVRALTETLALELARRGSAVRVTLAVPGSVHTGFGRDQGDAENGHVDRFDGVAAHFRVLEPTEAAHLILRAIRDDELYAITHPEWLPLVEASFAAVRAAFER